MRLPLTSVALVTLSLTSCKSQVDSYTTSFEEWAAMLEANKDDCDGVIAKMKEWGAANRKRLLGMRDEVHKKAQSLPKAEQDALSARIEAAMKRSKTVMNSLESNGCVDKHPDIYQPWPLPNP
jgi:hypothetical protein